MNLTIELADDKVAALRAHAEAHGLTLERWLEQIVEQHAEPASIAHLQTTNPKEWAHQFDVWVDSQDPNTPVLSDEAMSRESIYPDRI